LTGALVIDGFEYLREVTAFVNQLTSVVVDNNPALTYLSVWENRLTTLNVKGAPALESLDAPGNELVAVNLTNNPALNSLSLSRNKLAAIDLSHNPNLVRLAVEGNYLSTLDLGNNPLLEILNARDNDITFLNVRQNANLMTLDAGSNLLASIDVSANFLLEFLDVGHNNLTVLDVGNNVNLTELRVSDNSLSSLELDNNVSLQYLYVARNSLNSLDLSNNPNLIGVDAEFNRLATINLSGNHALEFLYIRGNLLDSLDVSDSAGLTELYADSNGLTTINLSNNPNLRNLELNDNPLSALDVSHNPDLWSLYVSSCGLNSLVLSGNEELRQLDVSRNSFSSLDLTDNENLIYLNVSHNSLSSLDLSDNDYLIELDVSDNFLGSLNLSGNVDLFSLNVSGNSFSSLNLNDYENLRSLNVSHNSLSSLDLSDNDYLIELDVSGNSLGSLNVGDMADLRYLSASGNSLNTLDLSGNANIYYLDVSENSLNSLVLNVLTNLQYLDASDNLLASLDLSDNAYLDYLDVSDNFLVSLDLSHNPNLKYVDVTGNPTLASLSVEDSQFSSLDFIDIATLTNLNVSGGRFTLSALYDMMSTVPNVKMGNQNNAPLAAIPSGPAPGAVYDLGSEASFNGELTQFSFKRDGVVAVAGEDYSISPDGALVFMDRGLYEIAMENLQVHGVGVYDSDPPSVVTSLIDVLRAGAIVSWLGDAGALWAPESSADSGKDWLHSGYGVRYLDSDDALFGAAGAKDVHVDPSGVNPGAVTVEADGYSFSGGGVTGDSLLLAAAPGSRTRFSNVINFARGAEVRAGNALVFDYSVSDYSSGVTSALYVYGEGSLSKDGDGVLALSGPSDYSGSTNVLMGTLKLAPGADISRSLAGGGLILSTGATFDISSYGSLAIPRLAVEGGASPAVIQADATIVADFSGAELSWSLPGSGAFASPLLQVNGEAKLDGATVFSITSAPARLGVALGEGLTLLAADALDDAGFASLSVSTPNGDSFTVEIDPLAPGRVKATLASISPWVPSYERMKAYPEAAAAALAFAGLGQDALAREGVSAAATASSGTGPVWGAFGAASGGRSRYNTGSRADVSGLSVLAGAAVGADLGIGRLALGIFAEAGRGDYDSHNSFANSREVDGSGDVTYAGGGILARWDAAAGAFPGLYLEASARLGRQETDFDTDDIRYGGAPASFKLSSRYWGLHGGLGRTWKPGGPDGSFALDLGAKILWTRQEGSEFGVSADRVRFEDADSLRVRAGARLAYVAWGRAAPYVGAYFEREFDGVARASVNDVSLETPSLRGNTGILELGVSFRPSENLPFSLEIGAQGYVGKREGFSGTATLKYGF
jgi:outer membrane autotransporter protein